MQAFGIGVNHLIVLPGSHSPPKLRHTGPEHGWGLRLILPRQRAEICVFLPNFFLDKIEKMVNKQTTTKMQLCDVLTLRPKTTQSKSRAAAEKIA